MPWVKIITIHSRMARMLLHSESAALPIGFGLMAGTLLALIMDRWTYNRMPFDWYTMLMLGGGASYLWIGFWQPFHRRMDLVDSVYIGKNRWMKKNVGDVK